MSQNNYLFERSSNEAPSIRKHALHWISLIMLAIVLTACGGGGGGGDDSAPSTTAQGPGGNGGGAGNGGAAGDAGNNDDMDPVDPGNNNGGNNNAPNEAAIFAATIHPEIRNPAYGCVGCHDNPLFATAPDFALTDPTASYNVVIGQGMVDVANTTQSRLYMRPLPPAPTIPGHNCGTVANCQMIADAFLVAINNYANQVNAGGGNNNNGNIVASATTNFSQLVQGSVPRADANQITFFDFSEGVGNTTVGTSNVGADITLNLEGTEWVAEGGLRNVDGKAQASLADSQKLFNLLSGGNQFSVEAWVIPENTTQTGPARIVSYSIDTGRRNFTLGQRATQYAARVQTLATGPNGSNPEQRSEEDTVNTELNHIVMTYDNMQGGRKIYLNGVLAAEETIQGDMLNWQDDNLFVLGNEVTNNRLWRGVFKMVAIHNVALNGAQVAQNFEAGEGAVTALRFDVATALGVPGYIEMQAYELDPFAYVFARPKLVTDATGVQVQNMRIGGEQ